VEEVHTVVGLRNSRVVAEEEGRHLPDGRDHSDNS
jgi:hypothetical protein